MLDRGLGKDGRVASSWLNSAPKRDVSGGRVIRHTREHRTNRVGNAFRMAAQSLIRSDSLGIGCPLIVDGGSLILSMNIYGQRSTIYEQRTEKT